MVKKGGKTPVYQKISEVDIRENETHDNKRYIRGWFAELLIKKGANTMDHS